MWKGYMNTLRSGRRGGAAIDIDDDREGDGPGSEGTPRCDPSVPARNFDLRSRAPNGVAGQLDTGLEQATR
jgi:hypothetical protein